MIRTVIIDDEAPARDELRYLLTPYQDITIIGEADNATTAIPLITREKPELIFLDIQMRGLSGLELAQIIREISPRSQIIFATAYDEYALKAFELQALDYIVKPIEEDRLAAVIKHALAFAAGYGQEESSASASVSSSASAASAATSAPTDPSPTHKLAVERDGHILLIDISAIYFITGESGRLEVHTSTGLYTCYKTLTELQERLKHTPLYRIHRSYIANLEQVREVIPWFKGTYWLRLPDVVKGKNQLTDLPVSKAQVKTVRELLGIS